MDQSDLKKLTEASDKPSALIRRGIPMVEESDDYCGCALGTALYALTDRNLFDQGISLERFRRFTGYELIAEIIKLPVGLAEEVSNAHVNRRMTREQCADWLESQGY